MLVGVSGVQRKRVEKDRPCSSRDVVSSFVPFWFVLVLDGSGAKKQKERLAAGSYCLVPRSEFIHFTTLSLGRLST